MRGGANLVEATRILAIFLLLCERQTAGLVVRVWIERHSNLAGGVHIKPPDCAFRGKTLRQNLATKRMGVVWPNPRGNSSEVNAWVAVCPIQ